MTREKRVVLITGSSSGIGRSLALTYNARGFRVYASARDVSSLKSLHSDIQKLQLDVTDDKSCKAAVDAIVKAEGGLDVLVANSGAGGAGPMLDASVEEVQKVLDVNLYGVIRLVKLVAPLMINQRSGLILPIGSVVGDVPTPWTGVCASPASFGEISATLIVRTDNLSKSALHAYTDTLAIELKPFNVNVCLVTPGAVTSEFGKRQTASINLQPGSVYEACRDDIYGRANRGQGVHSLSPSPCSTVRRP